MRSTLDELFRELEELKSLVASISPVNTVLAEHHDSIVRKYLAIRRRFDYSSFIIVLYASLENYLENLVSSYARLVAQRMPYSELPLKLSQKHKIKSAEVLSRGRLGEGRYVGIREVDVVRNLFDCLTGATPYVLNDWAIVAHDLNLRAAEIDALFGAVGIEHICDLVRRTDAMQEWFIAATDLALPPQSGVPTATIEQRITDVVERRNQVAHGGGSPLDLLGPGQMSENVAFIDALSRSIFSIVVAKYLQGHHIASGSAAALQLREGPYNNGQVVVVDRPAQRLYLGQPAFVVDIPGARWGRVLSLRVDDKPIEAFEREDDVIDVGIGLDFKIPRGAVLYTLEADDDAVWSTN